MFEGIDLETFTATPPGAEEPEPGIQSHKVRRDGKLPFVFNGVLAFSVLSSPNNTSHLYSGSPGRWKEYYVYITESKNLVIEKVAKTLWQGESFTYDAWEIKNIDDLLTCEVISNGGELENRLIESIGDILNQPIGVKVE
jgi:hypothetical protein